jgi:hypothetical protein
VSAVDTPRGVASRKREAVCVDEKSQIQAPDRTAPILPMLPGTPERATHEYRRAGASRPYAALAPLGGWKVHERVMFSGRDSGLF